MLELLLWPFAAGVVLTGIHAYFGLHVLAPGTVFVDLSLAQVAALDITIAILAGHTVDSQAAYWYALAFSFSGAVLFAMACRYEHEIQQEVVIGIVYAVCAALGVLALDRAPQGVEHIKQILIGSILTVRADQVAQLALLYSVVGAVHWLLRRPLIQASFHPKQPSSARFVWDVVFYASFAVVVTSSVRIAGVLLVFSYLIVPASIAGLLAKGIFQRLVLAWVLGVLITAIGLAASWAWDMPTGLRSLPPLAQPLRLQEYCLGCASSLRGWSGARWQLPQSWQTCCWCYFRRWTSRGWTPSNGPRRKCIQFSWMKMTGKPGQKR